MLLQVHVDRKSGLLSGVVGENDPNRHQAPVAKSHQKRRKIHLAPQVRVKIGLEERRLHQSDFH